MDFYLMNKDRKVLRFSVLGGGSETICKIVEEYEPSLKPVSYTHLTLPTTSRV